MPPPDLTRLRRAGAAAVVFDAQGRILLHRRADNNHWGLPGGSIEVGETADQAAVREVREETGYEVEVIRLIGVYSDPKFTTVRYPDGQVVSYVSVTFECRVVGGAPQLSDESSAVEWFDPRILPQPFLPNHVPRVEDAINRQTTAYFR